MPTADEQRIIDQYLSTRLTPASTFAPKTAPTPAPAPVNSTDFSTRLQGIGHIANTLLSGKAFIEALPLGVTGEQIDKLGTIPSFAIDTLLSPVGLASLALAPFTGGASVAGKVGLGAAYKAAPAGVRLAGEIGARVGSDLLVSGLAAGAGHLADKALPEDAPQWERLSVPLIAGLAGGIAGGKALSVAFKEPQVAAAALNGSAFHTNLPEYDNVVKGIKTIEDTGLANAPGVVKTAVAKGVSLANPSFGITSDLEKMDLAINQYKNQARNLTEATVAQLYPSNKTQILVKDGSVGTVPWQSFYKMSHENPAVDTQVKRWQEVVKDNQQSLNDWLPKNKRNIVTEPYIPVSDGRGGFVKPTNADELAIWEKLQAYGKDANHPEIVARATSEAAYEAEIEARVKNALVGVSFSKDDILNATPEGSALRKIWENAAKEDYALKDRLAQVQRLAKGGRAAQKDYARTVDEQLKETRQQLSDMLYPVATGREVAAKGGEVGVQTALQGLAGPLSTPNLPVVPRVPNTTRMLETAAKQEVTRLKQELKATPYRTNAAKVLRNSVEDAADVRAHLGQRMAVETRINQLEEALKKIEETKGKVKLAQMTNADAVSVARRDSKLAAQRTESAYKAITDYKKTATPYEVPYAAFGIPKEGNATVTPFKGRYLLDSEDQVKKVEQWINERITGQPGSFVKFAQNANDFVRYTSASLDNSGAFTVFLPMLFRDPSAWAKGFTQSWKTMINPENQLRYINDNIDTIRTMIFHGVPLGDIEATISGQRGGYAHALQRIPGLGNAFNRTQAAFENGVQVARVEAWKHLSVLPQYQGQERQLARLIRNLTNGLDSSNLGVNGKQQAVESVLLFSPRLFRSTMALMGSAMRPWSPEGADAAQTILRAFSATAGLFMMANYAAGIADGKSEEQIWQNLQDTANPLKGRQFMSVQLGDQWYGVGGTMRAVFQALGRSVGQITGDAPPGNPIFDFFQGRIAPLPRFVGAGVEALSKGDVNVLPFDRIESFPDMLQFTAKGALPFYVQDILQGDGAGPTDVAMQIVGLRTSPIVPSDVLNNNAYQRYNRPWSDLTDKEQADLKAEVPDLVAQARENGSKSERAYRTEVDRINTTTTDTLKQLEQLRQQGQFSQSDFRDQVDTILRDRWVKQAENRQNHGVLFDEPANSDKRRVTDAYFNTFKPVAQGGAELAPGVIDWDLWEQKQAELRASIASGAFGDASRAQQYLDERNKFKLPEELQWYQDAKDTLNDSGYYSIRDEVFQKYRSVVQSLVPEAQNASDLRVLQDEAANAGDMVTLARVQKATQFIDKFDQQGKKMLELQHPEVKQALFLLGRSNSPTLTMRR